MLEMSLKAPECGCFPQLWDADMVSKMWLSPIVPYKPHRLHKPIGIRSTIKPLRETGVQNLGNRRLIAASELKTCQWKLLFADDMTS